ncbi:MAG: hypothetical protein F2667_09465 [Actinobacteria bacterium]|uniref:Unannotated protein n=1 Tax=freshwater metagenome TaxID=449393 RepID=A0A6J6R2E1_9ZZZZ|nr:hypothetical protein [Actinomycetota bacterium]
MSGPGPLVEVDPFDLPEWLGVAEVTWTATSGLRGGHRVTGRLAAPGHESLDCDLLAVDEAYPEAVADDLTRRHAHQSWRHGEILIVRSGDDGGRVTLAVPGQAFNADLVLDAIGRLARGVGASADDYRVQLRIGRDRPDDD